MEMVVMLGCVTDIVIALIVTIKRRWSINTYIVIGDLVETAMDIFVAKYLKLLNIDLSL